MWQTFTLNFIIMYNPLTYNKLLTKNAANFEKMRVFNMRIQRLYDLTFQDIAEMPATASDKYKQVKRNLLNECKELILKNEAMRNDMEKTQAKINSLYVAQETFLKPFKHI